MFIAVSLLLIALSSVSLAADECEKVGGGCDVIPGGAAVLPWCGGAKVTRNNETMVLGEYKVYYGGAHFHRGYDDNEAARVWEHVDQDVSYAKIDWSKQSQECKIAYLALACAQYFEVCGEETCSAKQDCCANKRVPMHANIRQRLFDACDNADSFWTRKWPDADGDDAFDLEMPNGACVPDGSGGSDEDACLVEGGEACSKDEECWSMKCEDKQCVSLEIGERCLAEQSCATGLCERAHEETDEHPATCEGLEHGDECDSDEQCISQDCADGQCEGGYRSGVSSLFATAAAAMPPIVAAVVATNAAL